MEISVYEHTKPGKLELLETLKDDEYYVTDTYEILQRYPGRVLRSVSFVTYNLCHVYLDGRSL